MVTANDWITMCYAICGILLVRDVAGVPGCTFPPECTKLTTCASCVIGDDPSNHGLQILQRPDFFPPNSLLSLNSYTLDYPCNTSCKWDKLRKSCTDLPRSSPMNDRVNFVYPLDSGMPESALFDLYSRMAASKYCESETGAILVGAVTFPPYTLSPIASSPCYGPCPSYTQTSFFKTGIDSGLFPENAFIYKPYITPDALLADLQAYKIHIAFPVNSAVSELRKSKGIVVTKVTSAATAVLWRPQRVFQPAFLIIEAFAPVVGLFGVVFVGCLVSGTVSMLIELTVADSMLFSKKSANERKRELRTGKPLGRGFWFALNTIAGVGLGETQPMGFVSKIFCTIMVVCGLNVISIVNGNFIVNIGQYTSFQALDWLQKAKSTIVALDQSTTSASLSDSGFKVRTVNAPDLQKECILFGSAADDRALAGDVNAINVCYDYLLSTLSREQTDTSQLRLDPLPYTEEYFAAYNGVVILASNPYINYARTLGLNSVATGGYSPTGSFSPGTAFEGLNSLRSTVLATLMLVSACLGAGILVAGIIYACQEVLDRWKPKKWPKEDSNREHEMASISESAIFSFPRFSDSGNSESAEHLVAASDQKVS